MNTHKHMRVTGKVLCLLAIGGSLLTGCGLPGGEEGKGIPGDAKTRIQADLSGTVAECETEDMGAKEAGESGSGQEMGNGRSTVTELDLFACDLGDAHGWGTDMCSFSRSRAAAWAP